jgi:hypothetical protein
MQWYDLGDSLLSCLESWGCSSMKTACPRPDRLWQFRRLGHGKCHAYHVCGFGGSPILSSQKHPDMFGTLVICLPSKHEGGEVHVTHGGKEKILRTADSSEFSFTYLCLFVVLGESESSRVIALFGPTRVESANFLRVDSTRL